MFISFCTTCMNRLEFLKQTIIINLDIIVKFNKKYKDIHQFELVLCNYDSKDKLDEYVNTELKKYLDDNSLKYIVVPNKKFFNVGHAKNIAYRQSNGDILVNIDADNFITDEFIEYVIDIFSYDENVITSGYYIAEVWGSYGRICILKENFFKLGGYIEFLDGYGYEDNDIIKRAIKYLNCIETIIPENYVKFIGHTNEERVLSYDSSGKTIFDYIKKNGETCNTLLANNIMNPNKYKGIEFGMY
jgi:predicted glycosyltransferase involved in capsule biosynthesis